MMRIREQLKEIIMTDLARELAKELKLPESTIPELVKSEKLRKKLELEAEELLKNYEREIIITDINKEISMIRKDLRSLRSQNSNSWINGSFYFFIFIVIITIFSIISNQISWYAFPIVLIGGLLTVSLIGALQLRSDEKLGEENFIKLMFETFRRLILLKKDKPKGGMEDS